MNRSMKTTIAAISATFALGGGGAAAIAVDASAPVNDAPAVTAQNQSMDVTVDGLFKPGQELFITANCGDSLRATLTTSFGAETVMSPGADVGKLVGTVTAPDQIGPGPDEGYHTFTITCDNGDSETFRIPSAGNSDAAPVNLNDVN